MKQGKYKNQVTDTVHIDGTEIRVSGRQNTETKTLDINVVMKGESPFDFLVKCLANHNQNAFIHFLDYIGPTSEKGKGPLNPSEGGDVLALARRKGKYEAGVALEKKGYKIEDSNEQIPVNPKDEKEEMKRKISYLQKENEQYRKILTAVRKQVPNIPEGPLGSLDGASPSDGVEGVTEDFENIKVGEKRKGKVWKERLMTLKKVKLEKK